jgi:A1 cistron-splicing factor AAR2
VTNFQKLLANKFPASFQEEETMDITAIDDDDDDDDDDDEMEDGDDEDEDAPVVVAAEEVHASLARSSTAVSKRKRLDVPIEIQKVYPLLVAAIMPHEDILMTCARALDEQRDVSLVRQAAAYLEEVEQNN